MDKLNLVARFSCAALLLLSQKTMAQFNFQTYQDRNSPDFTLLDSTRDAADIHRESIFGTFIYHYMSNPVSYDQGEDGKGSLISGVQNLNLASEYAFSNRYSLGVDLSLHQVLYHGQGATLAFGDTRLFGRMVLLGSEADRGLRVSIVPSLYAPTGDQNLLLSNPHGGAGANLVVEKRWNKTRVALNFGTDYFPKAAYAGINYDQQFYLGAGLKQALSENWSMSLEWMGREIHDVQLGDLYCGGDYKFSQSKSVFFGGSLSSLQDSGQGAEFRAFLGFRVSPSTTKVVTQYVQKKIETVEKREKIHDCGPKPYAINFKARPLTKAEKRALVASLPYISTKALPISILNPGESTGHLGDGSEYVENGQVVFAIDIAGLPKRESVTAAPTMDLLFEGNKFWQPSESRTDMFCFVNEKVCSGDLYAQSPRRDNINSKFFSGKEPPNDYFTKQISETHTGQVSKIKIALAITRLIENSLLQEPLDLIYAADQSSAPKTLYFAVAHDIFLKRRIKLNLGLTVESCTEKTKAPTIERHEEETPLNRGGEANE